MWHRVVGLLGTIILAGVVGRSVAGRLGSSLVVLASMGLLVYFLMLLPRAAHRCFENGQIAKAKRRYRVLARLTLSRRGFRRARMSTIGCTIASGAYQQGLDELEAFPAAGEDSDVRTAWLGNQAYALLLRGGSSSEEDAGRALVSAEEACRLRPDVPALAHTRAMALARLGHTVQAITLLEALWSDDISPLLEAERCWELAQAWERSGAQGYADDYRTRARAAATKLRQTPAWLVGVSRG